MILLDSDIVIEVTRAHDQTLLAKWTQLAATDEAVGYSPVTAAELWAGARPREHQSLTAFFGALLCLPADNETGRIAGNYMRLYRASHNLELADALIAAAAFQNTASLWTRNRKHYPMKDILFY